MITFWIFSSFTYFAVIIINEIFQTNHLPEAVIPTFLRWIRPFADQGAERPRQIGEKKEQQCELASFIFFLNTCPGLFSSVAAAEGAVIMHFCFNEGLYVYLVMCTRSFSPQNGLSLLYGSWPSKHGKWIFAFISTFICHMWDNYEL